MRYALALPLALLAAAPAMAQDKQRDFCPDRPGLGTPPCTFDPGHGDIEVGLVYPPVSGIFETELRVAARVAEVIFEAGLARVERPADILAFVRDKAYAPRYRSLV